jgi:hypothetical protein
MEDLKAINAALQAKLSVAEVMHDHLNLLMQLHTQFSTCCCYVQLLNTLKYLCDTLPYTARVYLLLLPSLHHSAYYHRRTSLYEQRPTSSSKLAFPVKHQDHPVSSARIHTYTHLHVTTHKEYAAAHQ